MGKRKSRTSKLLAVPKKAPKLDTDFTCPFCNHPGAVHCSIFLKERRPFAVASCSVCKERYATKAHALTEAIDVYSEWIDSCVEANETRASSSAARASATPAGTKKTLC